MIDTVELCLKVFRGYDQLAQDIKITSDQRMAYRRSADLSLIEAFQAAGALLPDPLNPVRPIETLTVERINDEIWLMLGRMSIARFSNATAVLNFWGAFNRALLVSREVGRSGIG